MESETAANQFVESVAPLLEAGDLEAVLEELRTDWPPRRLGALLAGPAPETLGMAARCLAMTGTSGQVECLTRLLGHNDRTVRTEAEDALWSIWMRSGSSEGCDLLARAVREVKAEAYANALVVLDELVRREPEFAEAHHQRAIALCFLGRLEEAAQSYEQALKHNPYHYAAAAGLGHTYLERGDVLRALELYRLALEIHPGLAEVRDAVKQIEKAVGKREVA